MAGLLNPSIAISVPSGLVLTKGIVEPKNVTCYIGNNMLYNDTITAIIEIENAKYQL